MFKIIIHDNHGKLLNEVFVKNGKATLGSNKDNTVVLDGWKVAKVHALFELKEDGVYAINRAKMKPLLANGNRVESFGPLTTKDKVQIADYSIKVLVTHLDPDSAPGEQTNNSSKQRELYKLWQRKLHNVVAHELKTHAIGLHAENASTLIKNVVQEAAKHLKGVPAGIDKNKIATRVYGEIVGYGPLDSLFANGAISDIMVNTPDEIFYQEHGKNKLFSGYFTDNEALEAIIKRMVESAGRHIDEKSPLVDATLADGTRINAVISPLALRGASLTIRKVSLENLSASHLINNGTLNSAMAKFLKVAVESRKNIVIAGGTGTGKSTFLNVLSSFIPEDERIVTIEDVAELTLNQSNRVALESRPPNAHGEGEIKIRDLLKNALRMSPDRIVVGECRGGEALDMLQAMNTGHDGSLTTIHANSPRDCISRLEVLVLMSGMELPISAIRNQIASSVELIVQLARFPCGSRKVTTITEVCGMEGGTVQLGEIFTFEQTGYDTNHVVEGDFRASGVIPDFYEKLRKRGTSVDMTIFQ